MGCLFTVEFQNPEETADYYRCRGCFEDYAPDLSKVTHIALGSEVVVTVSSHVCGKPACFFRKAINLITGEPENRVVFWSECKVADLFCVRCCRLLGSKFVQLPEVPENSPFGDTVSEGCCMLDRFGANLYCGLA